MNEAKVGVFEDNDQIQNLIAALLGFEGHKVVVRASTLDAALASIALLNPGDIHVAVVDRSLGAEATGAGDEIVAALRAQLGSSVLIIGFSASGSVVGANENLQKPSGISDIASMVTAYQPPDAT